MKAYVALAITAIWAVSYIGALATGNYTGFEVSTPVMIIAATYLLALDIHRNGNSHH